MPAAARQRGAIPSIEPEANYNATAVFPHSLSLSIDSRPTSLNLKTIREKIFNILSWQLSPNPFWINLVHWSQWDCFHQVWIRSWGPCSATGWNTATSYSLLKPEPQNTRAHTALARVVPAAEPLFGSTQWARAGHCGLPTSECAHSLFVLVMKKARQRERTKVRAVSWQRVVVLSLTGPHHTAGDSQRPSPNLTSTCTRTLMLKPLLQGRRWRRWGEMLRCFYSCQQSDCKTRDLGSFQSKFRPKRNSYTKYVDWGKRLAGRRATS